MKINYSKRMLSSLFFISLTGCSLWNVVRTSEAPPLQNIGGFRALEMPPNLRVNKLPENSKSNELARALASPPPTSSAGSAVSINAVVTPLVETPVKGMFSPYFPTSATSAPPNIWTAEPKYDFPWINGSVPTRVNEEVTFGSGALMLGRLYAKVTFANHQISEPGKSVSAKNNEIAKPPEIMTAMNAEKISCSGVTCLDVARDMLVDNAKLKNWNMVFNRRVSMHQSYQFSKDGRLIGIEIHSNGGNLLSIEYNLMPSQLR